MIQYGMRCHDICPKGPLSWVLDQVQALGVHHIQLALGKSVSDYDFSTGHYSAGLGWHIGEELKKRQIHVAVLGCYINPADPDPGRRQAAIGRFIEHLKYARRIGADMVGTETGRFSSDFSVTPATHTEECYQTMLDSFRRIVHAAEQLGVTVGVEGVFDHTLCSPEMMDRFLQDIDSETVEVILDAVNLIPPEAEASPRLQEEILHQAFARYGDRVSVLHLKDFVFDGQNQLFRHPGEGHFHYPALLNHVLPTKPGIIGLLENSSPDRYTADCRYIQSIADAMEQGTVLCSTPREKNHG